MHPGAYARENMHVYLGAIVFASIIWLLRAGIGNAVSFHFLGATAMTLLFGWPLALIALSVVTGFHVWYQEAGLLSIPLNSLVMAGIPVAVTEWLLRWSRQNLSANLFVFVFINAFLAAMLGMALVVTASSLLLWWTGTFDAYYLQTQYLPYLPLLMFPEGLMNGMLIAIAVVYMPQWIPAFDDKVYLRKRDD